MMVSPVTANTVAKIAAGAATTTTTAAATANVDANADANTSSSGGLFPDVSSSASGSSHHHQTQLSPLQYSDMWSASCIWLYLLTGTRPYKSLNSLTVRGYSLHHLPSH